MKRWLLLLAGAAISVTVQSAAAPVVDEAIPVAFKHLFAPQKGPVTVDLYGATLTLPGESKFRQVTLDRAGEQKLREFLAAKGVRPEAQQEIVTQLLKGVESSSQCQGLISECALYPEQVDFVFDDKSRRLRIFVNEAKLDFDRKSAFFAMGKHRISLVNHSQLYAQQSKNYSTIEWQNDNALSLPLGYLASRTSLDGGDQPWGFEVYDASYVLDRQGFSLATGFATLLEVENSAFALLSGQNSSSYHATLFSNQRRQARSSSRFGSLAIFVAQSTEVEIVRDDQSLYRGMLPQGLSNVSFATFPTGSYDVEVIYRVGGQVTKEEIRHIYNVPVFTMDKGDYDWFAIAGQLADNDYGHFNYLKLGVNGRFLDTMLTGIGYGNVDGRSLFTSHGEFVPTERFRSSLTVTADLNGNTWYGAQLNLLNLYLVGEWLHSSDERFSSLFNAASHRMISAGIPFTVLGSNVNLSYSEYLGTADETAITSRSLFCHGAVFFSWGRLSGTVQYDLKPPGNNGSDSTDRGNWFFSVNLEIPFDRFTIASSYSDSGGQPMVRNTLRSARQLGQKTTVNGEISLGNDGNNWQQRPSALVTVNHGNDYLAANGSLYLNRQEGYNSNVSVQSTQLIDHHTLRLCAEGNHQSYLLLRNQLSGDAEEPLPITEGTLVGYLELQNQTLSDLAAVSLNRQSQVVPLQEYSQYQIRVNTRGTQFVSSEEVDVSYFTKPGTFLSIENRVVRVNQYIVSFVNEQGGLVSDLTCAGPACGGISTITRGVYKVSLFAGHDFTLQAGNEVCLLPEVAQTDGVVNIGRSICINRQTLARLLAGMPEDYRLYYLGVSKSVDKRLAPNSSYVRAGHVYGHFRFARDSEFQGGELVPREVTLPVSAATP